MSNDTLPEIRFPEFTDEWEQRKLGDESDVRDGTHDSPKYYDKGYPLVTSKNLKDFGLDLSNVSFISDEDFEVINKRSKVDIGDILFGMIGTIGNPVLVDRADFAIKNVALIKEQKKILNSFLIQILKSPVFDKYIKNENAGGTQKFLSLSKVRDFNFLCPNIDEQNCISAFFKKLDDTIALHQRKLDLLKETKKGFLQKMFPKNGAKVPEIRFSGFTEDWEQRRLSDVASIVGGGTPSTSNPEYWDGDIDWYAPAEIGDQIYVSKSLKTITELGQQKSSAKILPIGTVLFTSRAGIGNTAILAKEGTTNQGFQSIVPHKNKLDSYFIFSRTHELKRYGEVTGAGSTFAEVSGKQMAKMPILIPCINEQRKIGAFFEQLDTTITLHQRELDVLKETKKGFLQKMFV